jgi:DNA-binding transcriptional LysR family regulator
LLIERLQREAPLVDIAIVRIDRRDLEEDLQSGEIDLALDVGLPLSHEVRRERVSAEPLAVLARSDHPSIRGELSTAAYLAMEHVLITGRRRGGGYEDIALGRLGMSRRIRVRCQHHAAACEIVARSELLATMAHSQAQLGSRQRGTQLLPFPVEIPPLEMFLYWHANADADPGSQWLRGLLLALVGQV